jgi:hypothetical protein
VSRPSRVAEAIDRAELIRALKAISLGAALGLLLIAMARSPRDDR